MLKKSWKHVLKRAWSVRLIMLAGVLSALEVVVPFLYTSMPRMWFAVASFLVTVAAVIARLLAQKDFMDSMDNESQ